MKHLLALKDGDFIYFQSNNFFIVRNGVISKNVALNELITSVAGDSVNIFIGTAGDGLFRFDLQSDTLIKIGLNEEFINDLTVTEHGIYIALDDGIARYLLHGNAIERLQLGDIIGHIVPMGSKNLLAISDFGKIFKIDRTLKGILDTRSWSDPILDIVPSLQSNYFLTDQSCFRIDRNLKMKKLLKVILQISCPVPTVFC